MSVLKRAIYSIIYSSLLAVIPASAATLVVTNTSDSGTGSLRNLVASAASNDTITFTGIAANSTITLTYGQITFPGARNLTLDASASNTITILASPNSRVFEMPNNGNRNITLNNLIIAGGNLSSGDGGGISFGSGGALTLNNCTIRNNSSAGTNAVGGGLFMANAGGTLSINSSTFSDNSLTGNSSRGGGLWTSVPTTITNSTFSKNNANGNGSLGGGIYINGGSVTLNHVTVTLNTSSGNASNSGGGVFSPINVPTRIGNTIIAGNSASGTGQNSGDDINQGAANNPAFISNGFNLIGIGSANTGFTNGVNNDQVGSAGSPINANLAPLANNTGWTLTHALNSGSPAIDKGSAAGLTLDQRGAIRTVDIAGVTNASDGTDIGAFENQLVSAAGVGVGGQVLSATGRGVGRVVVTITGGTLAGPRISMTNPFGYYRFDDLEVGNTYILTVSSKSYVFANSSRLISLNDGISELDFIAEPY